MSAKMFRFNASIVIASYLPLLIVALFLSSAQHQPAEEPVEIVDQRHVLGLSLEDMAAEVLSTIEVNEINSQGWDQNGATYHRQESPDYVENSRSYEIQGSLSEQAL